MTLDQQGKLGDRQRRAGHVQHLLPGRGDQLYQYNLTIPGVVSGGGSILKSNNNGILYLAGSNTYSGGTVIVGDVSGWNTSNIVEINSDASLGTAPGDADHEYQLYDRLYGASWSSPTPSRPIVPVPH